MENIKQLHYGLLPRLFAFLFVFLGMLYSSKNIAQTQQPIHIGPQLAYYVGFHTGHQGYHHQYNNGYHHQYYNGYYHHNNWPYQNNYIYYGYGNHRGGYYWSNWINIGHSCKKSCLMNSRSGQLIRCKQVCY